MAIAVLSLYLCGETQFGVNQPIERDDAGIVFWGIQVQSRDGVIWRYTRRGLWV
jgi:hypothetical protein